jgi:hypothetical protein
MMSLKDAQIADLQEQVRFLRDMVQPSTRVQLVSHQANAILDGLDNIDPPTSPIQQEVAQEASNLLSGNY